MIKHYPIDEEDLVIVGTVSKKEMVEKLNYAYQQGREDYQAECEKLFGDNPPMHFTTEQIMWVIERIKQGRADAIDEYKWISVEDKMPKDCNEDWVLVLVYDDDFRCIPTVAEYRNGHWYGHTFCVDDDCIDGEDSPFEVRYWKPIYDEFHIAEQLKENKK